MNNNYVYPLTQELLNVRIELARTRTTQKALAARVGVGYIYLNNVLNGHINPSPRLLARIQAAVFGTPEQAETETKTETL